MTLGDLDASFLRYDPNGSYRRVDSMRGAHGVRFQCPGCSVGKVRDEIDGRSAFRGAHYIDVWFANPLDATPITDTSYTGPDRHVVTGTSLADLTIDQRPIDGVSEPCRWRGVIQNGHLARVPST